MVHSTGGDDDFKEEEAFSQPKKVSDIKSKTPVLDNFGRDLTRAAEEGSLTQLLDVRKKLNVFHRSYPAVKRTIQY